MSKGPRSTIRTTNDFSSYSFSRPFEITVWITFWYCLAQYLAAVLAAVLTVVARKCSDTAAHGPLTSEIAVSGPPSMLQARAGTEPEPLLTPVAPQSLEQTPMTTSSDPVIPMASSASVWNQATPGPSPEASPVKDSAAGRLGKDSHQAIPAPKTAAAAGRDPRKTPAHGPSASEITVPGPPSVQQAGRYDHGLFLPTPRSRADSCVGFVFRQNFHFLGRICQAAPS